MAVVEVTEEDAEDRTKCCADPRRENSKEEKVNMSF